MYNDATEALKGADIKTKLEKSRDHNEQIKSAFSANISKQV